MRVLLVEDRPSMRETLTMHLERAGGTTVTWAPHYAFASHRRWRAGQDTTAAKQLLLSVDLVLIDAFDRDQTQDDPTRSCFRGLDATRLLAGRVAGERPRVVAYSTAMTQPEVAVTLHCTNVVDERYTPRSLLEHLPSVLLGASTGSEGPPSDGDWKRIHPHLRPGANLALLHEMMEGNERAWRLVWDRDAPFDQAVQKWIRRRIIPWLDDSEHPTYRLAVEVTRKVAGFGVWSVG